MLCHSWRLRYRLIASTAIGYIIEYLDSDFYWFHNTCVKTSLAYYQYYQYMRQRCVRYSHAEVRIVLSFKSTYYGYTFQYQINVYFINLRRCKILWLCRFNFAGAWRLVMLDPRTGLRLFRWKKLFLSIWYKPYLPLQFSSFRFV